MTRVLYIPYYGSSNEYQNLLMSSVMEEGIEPVEGEMAHLFPLVRNVVGRDIDLIHLIWTHPFFIVSGYTDSQTINKLISSVQAVTFLLDVALVRLYGVSVVWTVHNKHNHEQYHLQLDHFVSRRLSSMVDKMTVECERAKTTIVDLFDIKNPDNIKIIREGSYVNSYPNEVDYETAKERLGIPEDEFTLVYFGQIREYKNVPELIKIFDSLNLDATLYIAGRPRTEKLENEVSNAIENTNSVMGRLEFIPNEEVQYYMNGADAVVLPYEDIMTSGSVLLAMSFGRPFVAPDLGCIPAVAGSAGNPIYDPNDPNGLGTALSEVVSLSSDELETIGDQNYDRATDLRWSDIAVETVQLYEQVLSKEN